MGTKDENWEYEWKNEEELEEGIGEYNGSKDVCVSWMKWGEVQ